MASYKFSLGQLVATPGALDILSHEDVFTLIERHRTGDWGDLCQEDRLANDQALIDGSRIVSAYRVGNHSTVWIITEADRRATTLLLPQEY